jgi:uncharacterized protein (TIGR04222 family)
VVAVAVEVGVAVADENGHDPASTNRSRMKDLPMPDRQHAVHAPTDAVDLLARIEAFGFSAPDDPLGFESRLADDQGWTLGYALAVAEEYRRFLVLTQVAGHAVSPSPDVDEAWHLHLTRTAHYEAMCTALFGRFLHHEPAKAGEGARHQDMYRETLAAYRQAFGATAPPVVWIRPGKPLGRQAPAQPRWTVPSQLRRGHRLAVAAVLLAIAGGLLLRKLGLLDPFQAIPPVTFLGLVLLATVALGWQGLRAPAQAPDASSRDRLEPFEAAWFSGGAERMAMTAIVALTERGVLLAPGKPSERGARPPIPLNMTVEPRCAHPAEAACLRVVADGGVRFTAACAAMRPVAEQVERRLVATGIADDVAALPLHRARALPGMVVLLAIELERIFHAIGTRQRIGFVALLALAGVGLVVGLAQRLRRANARSERVLRPLRLAAGKYRKSTPTGQALAFGVALIGGSMMADDLRFDGLKQQVNAASASAAATRRGKGDDGCSSSSCSSCSSDGASGGSGDGGSSSCGSSCGGGCGGGGD